MTVSPELRAFAASLSVPPPLAIRRRREIDPVMAAIDDAAWHLDAEHTDARRWKPSALLRVRYCIAMTSRDRQHRNATVASIVQILKPASAQGEA